MAPPDRKGGSGLSLRTLGIASAASLSAAMVTSRLFPPGTIYASAMTPVIVAAVSEMLSRPADRVTQLARQRRTMILEARTMEQARIAGTEPSPLAGAPEFAQGADAEDELMLSGNGSGEPPITLHGQRRGVRRVLHPKVWVATGVVAFVIAVGLLTLPELIFGGAVATSKKTTFFGGGSASTKTHTTTTPTQTQATTTSTTNTVTETQTATTPAPAQTQTDTTTTGTGTETAPSGGAPAPTDTGTSTSPLPGGAASPPPTP